MDYLQYFLNVGLLTSNVVLNLIINGLPSIQEENGQELSQDFTF